jgi:hypothetical protein
VDAEAAEAAALNKKEWTALGSVCAVLGSQWGDEGKGKLVDILAQVNHSPESPTTKTAAFIRGTGMRAFDPGCGVGGASQQRRSRKFSTFGVHARSNGRGASALGCRAGRRGQRRADRNLENLNSLDCAILVLVLAQKCGGVVAVASVVEGEITGEVFGRLARFGSRARDPGLTHAAARRFPSTRARAACSARIKSRSKKKHTSRIMSRDHIGIQATDVNIVLLLPHLVTAGV